jgi:hypothetical protein
MKIFSDADVQEIASRNKKIKNVLIAGVVGMSASIITNFVLGYFE